MIISRLQTMTQYVVVPPPQAVIPGIFRNVVFDGRSHDALIAEMQRFRGKIYHEEGAIGANDLTPDGRHYQAIDEWSWHVLSVEPDGRIGACLRYIQENHATCFEQLWLRNASVTSSSTGPKVRYAVEREIANARRQKLNFGEVGGWAVAEDRRNTPEALRIILATYGLFGLLGGCTGFATATFRHGSASILRRIGLSALKTDGQELPPYFDPHYGCQMEVLYFDSRFPNPKYHDVVLGLGAALTTSPVVCRKYSKTSLPDFAALPLPAAQPNADFISAA